MLFGVLIVIEFGCGVVVFEFFEVCVVGVVVVGDFVGVNGDFMGKLGSIVIGIMMIFLKELRKLDLLVDLLMLDI